MISEFNNVLTSSHFYLIEYDGLKKNHLKEDEFYKIIWARENEIVVNVDGCEIKISKNHIMYCTPERIIDFESVNKQGVVLVSFNREFYCIRDHDNEVSCNGLLFHGSSLPPVIALGEMELKSFDMMYEMLEEELKIKDSLQGEMLRSTLKQILIHSVRTLKKTLKINSLKTSQLDIIREFNILVEMHFKTRHKVKDYALLLNKSPKTISNLFLKHSSRSPQKIIADRICLEAQRLIRFSNLSLSEIAYELGFNSVSHFSKVFKKHFGISPKEFKDNSYKK